MRAIKSYKLRSKRKIIFIVYLILVLTFTFVVRETLIWRYAGKHEMVLVPFKQYDCFFHETAHMQWFWQIFLNIILFVPFGFLFPIIFCELLNRLKVPEVSTVFIGCIFSLAIETMQYITGRGLADIDDLINNTLGIIFGYLIYRAGKNRYEKRKGMDN